MPLHTRALTVQNSLQTASRGFSRLLSEGHFTLPWAPGAPYENINQSGQGPAPIPEGQEKRCLELISPIFVAAKTL